MLHSDEDLFLTKGWIFSGDGYLFGGEITAW